MKQTHMDRDQAEDLIQRLLDLEFADDDDEEGEVIDALTRGLVCPHILTLIYHTTPELPVSEIVDRALACQPFVAGPSPSDVDAGTDGH
ncbi:hypothetical protein ACFY2M_35390 [Streptomyces sp. NPDC001276]|uniref:hypothetical protein n=1 Tax=Streptomyces sp. NPDC001276 TaxID=3364555 RepID=UPI0036C30011